MSILPPQRGHSERMRRSGLDVAAVAATVLAVVMLVVYLVVMREQGDQPAMWAVVLLVLGAAAGYGAVRSAPYRRAALLAAACGLTALGVLAILTIGLPILFAGVLCLVAAVRQQPTAT
ncbi:hypothetical protein ACQE98_17445 [Ornithinimicrobium sp. W1679]|uniref:hypothetical protein n=1 Tax=Ornithinimicrobium sp. W1679 TaxID=3418770 RepID=UPI003CF24217